MSNQQWRVILVKRNERKTLSACIQADSSGQALRRANTAMRHVLAACSATLAACTSTSEFNTSTPHTSYQIQDNYQAVYQRVYKMALTCLPNGPAMLGSPVTNVVEGQLYPDLGHGEVRHFQRNLVNIPYINIKIERSGHGTTLQVATANMLADGPTNTRSKIVNWANGGTSCN